MLLQFHFSWYSFNAIGWWWRCNCDIIGTIDFKHIAFATRVFHRPSQQYTRLNRFSFHRQRLLNFGIFTKLTKNSSQKERERERNEELDEFDWVFNFTRIAIHLVFQNGTHCVLWRAWRELNIAIQELSNILSIFLHLSSMSLHSHMTLLQSIPCSFRSSATSSTSIYRMHLD